MELTDLTTEKRNPRTSKLDQMSTLTMVTTINQENQQVLDAINQQANQIALAIDLASERFMAGGRLLYCGAGTSGRLGVLDAVEITPTYGISPKRAFGLMAGGKAAMYQAIEGAEDSFEQAGMDLAKVDLTAKDVVIALAASGRTPYALGALAYAKKQGALTIGIACVAQSELAADAEVMIEAVTGPEVVTGSTRMKAGSAQKMILNTLSTGIMVKAGKVYQNLMVDLQVTNHKLAKRALNIVQQATQCSAEQAKEALLASQQDVKVAIVMLKLDCDVSYATQLLQKYHGRVAEALGEK